MYISRTFWFTAIIVALSHAGVLDEFDELFGQVENLFSEEVKEVEEKVIKTAKVVQTFYEHHKKLILAGEVLLLAGTGLGEAGMLGEILEMYQAGGVEALIEGAGEAAGAVRTIGNGVFEALAEVNRLPTTAELAAGGRATMALLDPWLDKLASDYVIKNYPLAGSQLVILIANLIATSGSHINTPEVACKTENVLKEHMKRTVEARLEKLKEPEGFEDAVTFLNEKRKVLKKKFDKNGYNKSKNLNCDAAKYPKCFTDKFKRKNKQICTSWSSCYGNYVGMIRHKTEAAFPMEIFDETCKHSKKTSQDQIDAKSEGFWTITWKRILFDKRSSCRPSVNVYVNGQYKHTFPTDFTFTDEKVNEVKYKPYEFGPVKKTQQNIKITLDSFEFSASEKALFTIEGNIYDLQKNGYTPKDDHNFLDFAFTWRDKPK